MPIQSNRILGGVGALLSTLGVISTALSLIQYDIVGSSSRLSLTRIATLGVSSIVGLLVFIGFILFLVAMYGFSRDYGDHRIFNYVIYGLIGTIISAIAIFGIWFVIFMIKILSSIIRSSSPLSSGEIQSLLLPSFAPLIAVVSVVALIWIFFNYKAYNLLAEKSSVNLFRTAANLLILGAAVNIVVSLGFSVLAYYGLIDFNTLLFAVVPSGVITYVSEGVLAVAFFRIKNPQASSYTSTQ